jgi:hypothetical protein
MKAILLILLSSRDIYGPKCYAAKYKFVGKKVKTNMETSREENQSIISTENIISW